jgi:voltage-gated sodium channel
MTLESWSMGIVRPVMEQYPYAWSFFVPFIIISSFTVLNLFIAIIVDSMQTMHKEEDRALERLETVVDADTRLVSSEINQLRDEVRALRDALQERRP